MANKQNAEGMFELWVLLHQTCDAVAKIRESELKEIGINLAQSSVLQILVKIKPRAIPATISRWIFRKPHTVFNLLKRMERQGLVKQSKDLERQNLVHIELTRKGKLAQHQSMTKMENLNKLFDCLTEDELSQLYSSLQKLRKRAFEQLAIPLPPYP